MASVPTGSATFYDGGAALTPNATVSGSVASYTVALPAAGNHTYQAQYLGDTNFAASPLTTATATVVVSQAAPALSLNCPEVTYDGNPHSCTGSATGVSGSAVSRLVELLAVERDERGQRDS